MELFAGTNGLAAAQVAGASCSRSTGFASSRELEAPATFPTDTAAIRAAKRAGPRGPAQLWLKKWRPPRTARRAKLLSSWFRAKVSARRAAKGVSTKESGPDSSRSPGQIRGWAFATRSFPFTPVGRSRQMAGQVFPDATHRGKRCSRSHSGTVPALSGAGSIE